MKYLKYLILFVLVMMLSACTNNKEGQSEVIEKMNETQKGTKEETNKIIDNVLTEENVIKGELFEKQGTVTMEIEVNQEFNKTSASKLANKYVEELKKDYENEEINVVIVRKDEVIMETAKNEKNAEPLKSKKIAVKAFVEEKIISFKENPISKQLSVLIDRSKMSDYIDGEVSGIILKVEKETYTFEENQFDSTLLQVNNTDFTEAQLIKGTLEIK